MGYTFRNCSWDDTTASVSANATQEVLHMCHGEWLEAASSPSGRQFQAKSTSPLWGLMVPLFCYLGLLSTTNIMGQHYKRALSLITLVPDFLAKDTWKKHWISTAPELQMLCYCYPNTNLSWLPLELLWNQHFVLYKLPTEDIIHYKSRIIIAITHKLHPIADLWITSVQREIARDLAYICFILYSFQGALPVSYPSETHFKIYAWPC